MKKDPVCGMEVSEKTEFTTLHGAWKLYFCSNECRSEYLHDPEKYPIGKTAWGTERKAA